MSSRQRGSSWPLRSPRSGAGRRPIARPERPCMSSTSWAPRPTRRGRAVGLAGLRAAAPRCRSSLRASAKCCACSPKVSPTSRLPSASCSASTPCTDTSRTSCASWGCHRDPRQPRTLHTPGSWAGAGSSQIGPYRDRERWPWWAKSRRGRARRVDFMNQRTTSTQAIAKTAAQARIEEVSSPWALGDYDRFARELVWGLGPELVEACAIGPGERVLDVAAGTGNVALRAAQAGAQVVASDLTRESLAIGERHARELGLEIEWVQADAQALPFADGEFDVVASAVGAIFAPDHQAVADELMRVCRPGGTIGMVNFTPEGNAADFFGALAPYAPPPPPGALPPVLWGSEQHVREL